LDCGSPLPLSSLTPLKKLINNYTVHTGPEVMNITAILAFVGAAMSAALALAALVRRPRTVARAALGAGLGVLSLQAVLTGLAVASTDPEARLLFETGAVFTMAAIPGPWILFSLTYSRGNWQTFMRRWRVLIVAAFILPVLTVLLFRQQCVLGPGESTAVPDDWLIGLAWPGSALVVFVLLSSIFVLMNLERTFRASVGTMRWRIKYMVLGVGLWFGVRVYTSSQMLLYSGITSGLATVHCVALILACALIGLAAARAGLREVDVYPSQTVIQHSITIVIAGVYLFVVGILAKLLRAVAGDTAFSLNAFLILVALVGVTIIILSERLRERIKWLVSRHFKRPHYDYRQVWSTFTARTASLVKTDQLCRAATQWLSENLRVLSVSLWLVDEARNQVTFGASTTIGEEKAARLLELDVDSGALIPALRGKSVPFDLDQTREKPLEALKQCHPDTFRASSGRICAPIASGGELLGFMVLGDRVNGVPFSIEDLDLLHCIANQLAGNLLNIRLSEDLLQAREMEAFQTISAFFVHDLKNTASTLSLMLQNLPAHFDDPEFRKDALRGLGKSVDRINELIGRLTLLRQEMQLNPREVDLNEVVGLAVSGVNGLPGVTVERAFGSGLPKLRFDPDKIQKVLANLLTNAVEATGGNGEISVATSADNEWATVSVTDNGCGMTSEFISHSLFRPFRTTKKKGIGIGMFLSKMVIEAHEGKIEVDSQPGKGTTFRVLLPIRKQAA
jgi:putative PEP-CTERM system histidine kinase